LKKVIPDQVRIPCYIVVIATFVSVLQMLLQWIASGDNPAKLKQIVREKIKMSDEGYAYADKLIDIAATYAKTPSGTDSLLHVIYYIFYGV